MSFPYADLFGALGSILARLNEANTYRGTTLPAGVATLENVFDTYPDQIDGLYAALRAQQSAGGSLPSYLRTLARNTVIAAVNAYQTQPDNSLTTALATLVSWMEADGQTVAANIVGATITEGIGNIGNAHLILSKRTRTGRFMENLYAEAIAIACTTDAQADTVAEGNEVFTVRGQQVVSDPLSWLWPGGSGSNASLVVVDPLILDGGTGTRNALTNGSFETWSGSPATPTSWTIRVGTAGSTILRSSSIRYDGSACLSFAGDGATASTVDQPVMAAPLEVVHVCCWAKVDSAPAAGVLEVALVDGSGVITTDEQGTSNSFGTSLTTIGTTFLPLFGAFRTPAVLPPTLRLRVRLSTPLSTGRTAYVDKLSLARPVQLYPQGLYLSCHAGNIPVISFDSFTVTTTNDRAGEFQTGFDRLFGMRGLGLLLPSAVSPTISDALIV